ncbi:MAG: hypothetical protein Q4D04_05030 [Clostridia bacterium]|nr:hypothetical protein [Clostridia bacterium]
MRKRLGTIVIVALIAAVLSSSALASYRGYIETPTIDGSVFLRSGGSMSYPAIGYGMCDDSLTIHRIASRWDRVTITSGVGRGRTGWMYNGYIKILKDKYDITSWGALARVKDAYADSGIKLYKQPSTRSGYKRWLYGEDALIILSRYSANWYKVQLGSTYAYGYVYRPRIANGVYATVSELCNMYKRASYNSAVLYDIDPGDEILVVNIGARWSKIRYLGRVGYVRNDYIALDEYDIDYEDEDEYDY